MIALVDSIVALEGTLFKGTYLANGAWQKSLSFPSASSSPGFFGPSVQRSLARSSQHKKMPGLDDF